ncbi:MAG TPA: glycosyltransferase family 2 protein, partial [Patescibacteria group bacterium]|nr:glycosyltransferase family 2 protein [Patescibacteria group bacterium]
KLPELSVFFPFWNEEKNIDEVVANALAILPEVAKKYEVLLIDDGSSDNTLLKARELAEKNPLIKVISHMPNRGYGAALRSGFEHSRYNYIVFTDGDLQFDFSQITRFIEKIDEADIVIGFRTKRRDQKLFKRLLLMNLLKIWDFILFGFYFRDIDCGFKMFTRHALDTIGPLRSEGAMITTEILAKATKKKLKIVQVGVDHFQRLHGEQSGANIFVIIRAVLESLTLFSDIKSRRF